MNLCLAKTDYLNYAASGSVVPACSGHLAQLPLWLYGRQKYDLPQKD